MKILETQSAVLTNYEVLTHLAATRAKPRTTPQKHLNVNTVLKEVTDYLSPPPTSRSRIPRYQNPLYSDAAIRTLITALKPYNLTKSEVLMIVNLRPDNLGLLDCVVEECDERFTAEQQDEIVGIIGNVLGREEGDAEGEGANGIYEEVANGNHVNASNEEKDDEDKVGEDGPS